MDINFSETSRAAILLATSDTGDQRGAAAIPTVLEAPDSPVRDQAFAVREAAKSFASQAAAIVATYTLAARVAQLRGLAVKTFAPPVQRLIASGQAEARAIGAAWSRLITVPPATATTAILRQQDRAGFGALPVSNQAAWIEHANVDQLESIIEAGRTRFPGVPTEIWDRAEGRYASLNFVRMTGTAADYSRKPTIDDPIAIGVDMDAAEAAADEGLLRHRQRSEITDGVKQVVQGIANVVALTCDLDVGAAFELLSTGKVPA